VGAPGGLRPRVIANLIHDPISNRRLRTLPGSHDDVQLTPARDQN
jgi:hypothetical protein